MGDLFLLAMTGVCPQVTLVDSSWVVVAGGLTGVDFIPMTFLRKYCFYEVLFLRKYGVPCFSNLRRYDLV